MRNWSSKKQNYNVRIVSDKKEGLFPVKGFAVHFTELPTFKFFVHHFIIDASTKQDSVSKPIESNKWTVSELSTGLKLTKFGYDTIAEAVEVSFTRLWEARDSLPRLISSNIDTYGVANKEEENVS